jgi:hypothetical protein
MRLIDPPSSPEEELNMPNIQIIPHKGCDKLDDPPDLGGFDPFKVGKLASNIPNAFANGHAYGRVCQIPAFDTVHFTDDDAAGSTNVDVKQDFVIDVYWDLSGQLISAFGGNWVVSIVFDCASNAALDFQIYSDYIPYGCPNSTCHPPTTTNTRQYHASFRVPANTVPLDPNSPIPGTFYELDVAIVLLDTCNYLPSTGITGEVPLEEVLFYSA